MASNIANKLIHFSTTYHINLNQENSQLKSLSKLPQPLMNVLWIKMMVS